MYLKIYKELMYIKGRSAHHKSKCIKKIVKEAKIQNEVTIAKLADN